jgi:phosphatidylserine decarboxylase
VAWHPKSSLLNERNTVVTQNALGIPILYRQIAGAAARRIVCYVKEGDVVQQGEEYGFIKFGSRLDLFLPTDIQLNIRKGDKVTAGETIIASFAKQPDTYEDLD